MWVNRELSFNRIIKLLVSEGFWRNKQQKSVLIKSEFLKKSATIYNKCTKTTKGWASNNLGKNYDKGIIKLMKLNSLLSYDLLQGWKEVT